MKPSLLQLSRSASVLILWLSAACDASAAEPASAEACRAGLSCAETLWRQDTFVLNPKSGGAPYQIELGIPAGPPPASGYPVIYVLDAAQSFATVTDILHLQELFFGPVVVVGVRYHDPLEVQRRGYDMSPTPDESWAKSAKPGDVGGADTFLAFIQNDLKPAVMQRAKVDVTRQALFGHSFSGLFVLHVLFSRPDAFDTYVAASPMIGYGGSQIRKEVSAVQTTGFVNAPRRLLVTKGELESDPNSAPEVLRFAKRHNIPPPPPPPPPGQDDVSKTAAFAKSLQSIKGLEVNYVQFEGETHNSSIPAYLGRGVRWTLSGWNLP